MSSGRVRKCAGALSALGLAGALSFVGPARASAADPGTLGAAATIAKPAVVLIEYQVSALAQNITTGDVFHSWLNDGPVSVSFIGTGFFVSSDGFIVTAAHLAAPTDEALKQNVLTELYAEAIQTGHCDSCGADPGEDAASVAAHYSLTSVAKLITVYTQDLDLTTKPSGIRAELRQSSPVDENDTAVLKVSGSNFPVLQLGDSSAAQVGDPAAVIGYPSTAIDNVDLKTLTNPTVTSGTITNKQQQRGFDRLQADVTAEHGNSGGPLINTKGQVIGIVSNGPTSTTNFYIPSNAVKGVMTETGVNNNLGSIDRLWRDGLTAYNGHHYRRAADLLDQCAALNKIQVGCRDLKAQATASFAQDVPVVAATPASSGSSSSSPVIPIAAGAGGLIVLVGVFLLVRSRRRPAGAAPAASASGVVQPPQSQAPAAPSTYEALPAPTPGYTTIASAAPPAQSPVEPATPDVMLPAAQVKGTAIPTIGFQPRTQQTNPAATAVAVATDGTGARPGPKFCPECGTPMLGQPACAACGYQPQA